MTAVTTTLGDPAEGTRPGNYFVSNYPPYSVWDTASIARALEALDSPPAAANPLGVYLHVPFCRKRCHFCYFKVYTDKNAGEVEGYIETMVEEMKLHAAKPFIGGRKPSFVYFGGGTPSYISTTQLGRLAEAAKRLLPWDEAEEVAFECEPGTITEPKLKAIKEIGVTRLSLGIENYNDEILKANGRAHLSKEIDRSYAYARSAGFEAINIDLIAGMVGETEENWRECVRKTIDLAPESVTVYQMEVPYNTTIFKEMKVFGQEVAPVASWQLKREWVKYAFAELEKAGYTVGSAYTAVKDPQKTKFLYRDLLWRGADMLGLGVASFSHVQGMHFQNEHEFERYRERVAKGEIPVCRALETSADDRLIREYILQMKLGRVGRRYFVDKFGVDPHERFAGALGKLSEAGLAAVGDDGVELTRDGLMRVDGLLHQFFRPEHQLARRV
ncbi:MAG: coproporphyrinogen III oxidase family protein [Bryobacterales bacterium]|nr:coproporphyrinogen III oxidase family protein [Bryobacterales bacterium]